MDGGGVERRRQTARKKGLAQYLRKSDHGPWWTAKDLALLGTLADEEVAAKVGRTPGAVRSQRQLLGIPNPSPRVGGWTAEEDDLVRRLPPREAARRTGRTINAVYARRYHQSLLRQAGGRRPSR